MLTTMRHMRAAAALLTLVLVTLVTGPPVASAAPVNNRIENATVIGSANYNNSVDTSGSTAAASDPKDCFNSGSVWYRYTAASTDRLVVDTVGNRYGNGTALAVYAGRPGSLSKVGGCSVFDWEDDFGGSASVAYFNAVAGTTYYVMVGECCSNGRAGGGPLALHVRTAPKVTVRNSDSGTVSKLSGDARVGGMIQCDRTLTGFMFAVLSQRVGESSLARGFGGEEEEDVFPCSTVRSHWSMVIFAEGPVAFVEGDASLRLRGSFCRAEAPWRCGEFDRTRVVHLTYR
jgi:hypothetical protein